MLKLDLHGTSIGRSESDWVLSLRFLLEGCTGWFTVRIHHEPSMIMEAMSFVSDDSLAVGFGGPELRLAVPADRVCPSDNRVETTIFWFEPFAGSSPPRLVQKQFRFKWIDPVSLPNDTSFKIEISKVGRRRPISSHEVTAIRLDRGVTHILGPGSGGGFRFFFPVDDLVLPASYGDVFEIGSMLQELPDSAGWAFTSPNDVEHWESLKGMAFLARQFHRALLFPGLGGTRRLALCPYSLGTSPGILRRYLRILQLHSDAMVNVAVVEPDAIADTFGEEMSALGGFGSGFAAKWEWHAARDSRPQESVLFFDRSRVDRLSQAYDELFAKATPWASYRKQENILFSDVERSQIVRALKWIRGASL